MKALGKPEDYMKEMQRRTKESRAYTEHQLVGLEVAEMLGDSAHKSLYIRLAKQKGRDAVLAAAKSVAQNKNVQNKGAYFMRVIHQK